MKLLKIGFICFLIISAVLTQKATEYDDDEFTVSKSDDSRKVKQVNTENKEVEELRKLTQRASESNDQPTKPGSLPPYMIESIYIIVIIVYGINYWYGSRKNQQIADSWLNSVKDVLENNFSSFHGGRTKLTKETSSSYKLICTGRVNTLGVQITLTLRKRHDLLSLLSEFIWKSHDEIKLDFALTEESVDTFVFGLTKSRESKKFVKANPDLNELSKLIASNRLSSPANSLTNFTVYSEFEDVISDLLTKEVVSSIQQVESSLSEIHISDQFALSPTYKNSLQIAGRLTGNNETSENLLKLVINMIDMLPQIRLSKLEKQKAEKVRKAKAEAKLKETMKERQDAIQQKKIEQKQKLMADMEKLSPDQQRKLEEKLYKQELKKKQSKLKMVVKA